MIDNIDLRTVELPLRRTFTIARGTTRSVEPLLLRLENDGVVGWGEAHPMPDVTGETPAETRSDLEALDPSAIDPEDVQGTLEAHRDLGPAALAALDLALVDLVGRRADVPAHEVLDLPSGQLPSAATVTLTDPQDAIEQANAWINSGYVLLKLKVGDDGNVLDLVDAVRGVLPEIRPPMPEPEIWIDANEALTVEDALALLPRLADREVALLEQPLPRDDLDGLAQLLEASRIPIVVDEPIQGPADVERVARLEGPLGINVKVQKVGGLHAARACIDRARKVELPVLVGCSIETGLGIAAGASLAGAVDRADLDGNLFLERDPFPLPRPMPGHVGTRAGAGLGVHLDPRFETLSR